MVAAVWALAWVSRWRAATAARRCMAVSTHRSRKNAAKAVWRLIAWMRRLARSVHLWAIKLHVPSETHGFLGAFVGGLAAFHALHAGGENGAWIVGVRLPLNVKHGRERGMKAFLEGTVAHCSGVKALVGESVRGRAG